MYIKLIQFVAGDVKVTSIGNDKVVSASEVDLGDLILNNKDLILDYIGTYEVEKFLEDNM